MYAIQIGGVGGPDRGYKTRCTNDVKTFMMAFVNEDIFAAETAIRRDANRVHKWQEFDTVNVYYVERVEETVSKYPEKLSGIIHCIDRDGTHKKVFGPHALLLEIQENNGKKCFFRSLGTKQLHDLTKKHEFDFYSE